MKHFCWIGIWRIFVWMTLKYFFLVSLYTVWKFKNFSTSQNLREIDLNEIYCQKLFVKLIVLRNLISHKNLCNEIFQISTHFLALKIYVKLIWTKSIAKNYSWNWFFSGIWFHIKKSLNRKFFKFPHCAFLISEASAPRSISKSLYKSWSFTSLRNSIISYVLR